MGCATCHLGDPQSDDKAKAHRGMTRDAGDLAVVTKTCGKSGCHPGEHERVADSLMTTARGIVAVDRWAWGEAELPTGATTIQQVLTLPPHSDADRHLSKLCAGCHMGASRSNRDDVLQGQGVGCAACHTAVRGEKVQPGHPSLDSRPDDRRCQGCHSRSSRISLTYQGLYEPAAWAKCPEPVALPDGRTLCQAEADVHQTAGLACIDCHGYSDVMGRNRSEQREFQAVDVRCESCHGPVPRAEQTTWPSVLPEPLSHLAGLRAHPRQPGAPARLGKLGALLWNIVPAGPGNPAQLLRKASGEPWDIKPTPVNLDHRRPGHERLSCQACHSAVAPTCPTCHTGQNAAKEQWDFAAGRPTQGQFVEAGELQGLLPPALGMGPDGRILPAIPGMLAQLKRADGRSVALHLFATLDPHSTRKISRTCSDCHRQPRALGLGQGQLDVDLQPAKFTPFIALPADPSRATDGWTTLTDPQPGHSSQPGARSLNSLELQKITRVGRCLTCHDAREDVLFGEFAPALRQLQQPGNRCRGAL